MNILDVWPQFLLDGFLAFAAAWFVILLYEAARGVNPYSLPNPERKGYRRASVKAAFGFAAIIVIYKIIFFTLMVSN